jgi:hypothetical protein
MNSAAFDDERDEYTAPGHTAPLIVPGVFGGGALELCDHSFELQSLRLANAELLARVDNLQTELADALRRLDVANDGD